MTAFVVKGWCPDAWRPMMAGDGLLVRVRAALGRITREQMLGLCAAAIRHGNGQIDLTNRANLQIRGVREDGWRPLIATLIDLALVDADPIRDARANMLVTPLRRIDDDTHRIALDLRERLADLPDLPGKVGIAIDAGAAPILHDVSADFRIERAGSGGLILRADGRDLGTPLVRGVEVDRLIALARWFVDSGGASAGRMAKHRAALPEWAAATTPSASSARRLEPGPHALGIALGLPFGRFAASTFARLLDLDDGIRAVRLTPWRIVLCEIDRPMSIRPDPAAFIVDPSSPLRHADACVGAPACPQASVETRDLARHLAPHIAGRLHVSGCAKGCGRGAPADVVLTGRAGRYDLAFDARAGAPPVQLGLDAAQTLAHFGAP